jgi:hypothetical protein
LKHQHSVNVCGASSAPSSIDVYGQLPVALDLSVVDSCRQLEILIRDYLADILPGLANTSIQRIAELTPVAWIAKHTPVNP